MPKTAGLRPLTPKVQETLETRDGFRKSPDLSAVAQTHARFEQKPTVTDDHRTRLIETVRRLTSDLVEEAEVLRVYILTIRGGLAQEDFPSANRSNQ